MHSKAAMWKEEVFQFMPYINACSTYIAESNLDEMHQSWSPDIFQLPGNQTLSGLYGEQKYSRYRKMIKKSFDLDLDAFQKLTPFFIMPMLQEKILPPKHSQTMDEALWGMAKSTFKTLDGLESSSEQREIYRKIPMAYQLRLIPQVAQNPNRMKSQIHQLLKLFRTQRHQQLYLTSRRELGKLRKLMLNYRNKRMAIRLFEQLKTGQQTFCSLGAAHLGGKFGLRALLLQQGVRVKALPCHWLT